jgi:hypothetical protein
MFRPVACAANLSDFVDPTLNRLEITRATNAQETQVDLSN